MTMTQTIPLSWALRISAAAIAAGVREEDLLEKSLIDRRHGDHRDTISHAQYILLCMNTALSTEDALHGLGSRNLHMGYSPLTVRVMDGCATLEDAIHSLDKFYRLASSSVRVKLTTEQGHASLIVHAEGRNPEAGMVLEENQLGWLFVCCSHFLGRFMPLIDATVRNQRPVEACGAYWALRAQVRRGEVSALRFDKTLLAAPRVGAAGANAFWDCLRPWVQFVEGQNRFPEDPARTDNRTLRLKRLAQRAGVSASTLRRRFRDNEGGFRDARRRAIVAVSLERLKGTQASVEAIAAALGYADARSFRRFLKSAIGQTPDEIRKSDAALSNARAPSLAVRQRIEQIASLVDH